MRSLNVRSRIICRSTLSTEWITVEWSRPPNAWPISTSCILSMSRARYIATWRGIVRVLVRALERRPSGVTPQRRATISCTRSMLGVGVADVCHESPLEARDQPVLETGDLLRRPVRGEHDLLVALEQGIERVEELLLRHFLAFQEMHVVHQEEIDVVAVAPSELGHGTRVNRFDDLVDELLGAEVLEPRVRMRREHGVRDRLHQVRL